MSSKEIAESPYYIEFLGQQIGVDFLGSELNGRGMATVKLGAETMVIPEDELHDIRTEEQTTSTTT